MNSSLAAVDNRAARLQIATAIARLPAGLPADAFARLLILSALARLQSLRSKSPTELKVTWGGLPNAQVLPQPRRRHMPLP
jgi:hypothetical protein